MKELSNGKAESPDSTGSGKSNASSRKVGTTSKILVLMISSRVWLSV